MSFIGEEFEEQLTHEGILDLFKDKNIKTTERTLRLIDGLNILQSFDDKNWCYVADDYLGANSENSDYGKFIKSNKNKILDYNKILLSFISSGKKDIIINKDSNLEFKNLSFKTIFSEIKKGLKSESKFKSIFNTVLSNNKKLLLKETDKDLEKQQELFVKVIDILNKENSITTDKVTTESALTIEEVTTETAVNLSGVLELIKARDELETLSHSLTTESGFTFVTKVKDFFANTIREIKNKLSNIFSQQDVTLKYQEDKIKELKLLTNICSRLGSIKFSQIEYIELPIMMGMKPNYNQTVFELNNLLVSFKGAIEQIEDLNNLLSNLIVDKDDIRISSNPKLYKYAREILDTRNKTTRIVNEITETKQPVDVKQAGKLFNNLGSIKDINISYINLYQETIKFDISKYIISINRLSTLLTAWIDSVNDRDGEVKYSSNVITVVQDNVSNIANITTNLGIYIAYLNQTSAFFATDVNMLSEKI